MNYRVGPYVYRVEPVAGYIEHEGQACLGLCDNERHVLYISDQASLAQQVQVICHEYMEAWIYHFGANLRDKEDYCDLFGLAMTQFTVDLMHQMRGPAPAAEDPDLSAALTCNTSSAPPAAAPSRTPSIAPGDRYHIRKMYQPPQTSADRAWVIHLIEPAA